VGASGWVAELILFVWIESRMIMVTKHKLERGMNRFLKPEKFVRLMGIRFWSASLSRLAFPNKKSVHSEFIKFSGKRTIFYIWSAFYISLDKNRDLYILISDFIRVFRNRITVREWKVPSYYVQELKILINTKLLPLSMSRGISILRWAGCWESCLS